MRNDLARASLTEAAIHLLPAILIVLGLSLFEVVSSLDNAIINAEVLSTMQKKPRQWFLTWGILIAVFGMRGVLPWLIVWVAAPSLGPVGAITAAFSGDPRVHEALDASAPVLLMGGGVFLVLIFLNWLFMEPKSYGLKGERFFHRQSVWFYAVASVFLSTIVGLSMRRDTLSAFGAVVGSTAFFISHGFKQNAEQAEKALLRSRRSDVSKLLYLEVLDATFSIDGVLGAFAFTLSVPLILIGNGIGAVMVRNLTVGNISRVKKYQYLQNGAMYSVLVLGTVMLLEGFRHEVPYWVSPLCTVFIIGYFFNKSRRELAAAK